MTNFKTSSAIVAFDDVQWEHCGVVLGDELLTITRAETPEMIVWPVTGVHVNGPRSMLARRVDDGKLITIVREGGCRC